MRRPLPFRRAAQALAGTLCVAVLACSGGRSGPTEPPGPGPDPQPAPQPGPPEPTDNIVAGTYALARVNDSEPGRMVTLANPDGSVVGLYRFHENTRLDLTEQQTWSLSLQFEDDKQSYEIEDRGRFKRSGDDLQTLSFRSEVYGDVFLGRAVDGIAAIQYDTDGDGQADAILVFQRVLGPGD